MKNAADQRPSFTQAPPRDIALVVLVYALAALAGMTAGALTPGHAALQLLAATSAATIVVYTASALTGNASLYDPYWSIAPIAMGLGLVPSALASGTDFDPWRATAALALTALYAMRLTGNWLHGWRGMEHQDWRYEDIRARTGVFWQPVNFLGIHLMPTLMTWAGTLPLIAVLAAPSRPFGSLDLLAAAVAAFGIGLEAWADAQLHRHRATREDATVVLDTGVWAWCRHPNYLGEILFWWGLFGFALAADYGAWWTGAGALAITALFMGISITLIEDRLAERKPTYGDYRRRVPRLLPLGALRRG
jgi:steroid 5-alpha reductase family enzyme